MLLVYFLYTLGETHRWVVASQLNNILKLVPTTNHKI